VAEILALGDDGTRLMPLVSGSCSSNTAQSLLKKHGASDLFSGSRAPEAALGGLWLYFGCREECHQIVQDLESSDASFWHGIVHRQEPDAGNSSYWFRRTGDHPVFPCLRQVAHEILKQQPPSGFLLEARWNPFLFIEFCEQARRAPGSASERCALEIQRAEWQLLFDHCARKTD
jgi:hypothetical protein